MPAPTSPMNPSPFALGRSQASTLRRFGLGWVEHAVGLRELDAVYRAAQAQSSHRDFVSAVLDVLQVRYTLAGPGLAEVPRQGPLVVVANHPFGAIEGLVLDAIVRSVRSDGKFLANHLLGRIPELCSRIIPVDPFGGPDAARRNRRPMREAAHWLRSGGALIVFPAGEVAHSSWRSIQVAEPDWSETIGRLVLCTKAAVVPMHVAGRNGPFFQLLGLLHPRLRTAWLPRALLKQRGRSLAVQIGEPLEAEHLCQRCAPSELSRYLRDRTLSQASAPPRSQTISPVPAMCSDAGEPVEPPGSRALLLAEMAGLPPKSRLLECGDFEVCCCPAALIPRALHEIGRLREITFRQVGEGTGRSIDLDRFDQTYLHLFVWHRTECRILGAYRLGPTDRIVAGDGVRGLYTHTLFRYSRRLLAELGPALELGRSFVIAEYQKSYAPLMLLWRGIGRFIAENPRYRVLFGAVSISAEYDSMTKRLLMSFLEANCLDRERAALARPRNAPVRCRPQSRELAEGARVVSSVEQVDELVRRLEAGARGVPVLIRQYLKLNARLLGFNVDPAFRDALDGLFYVDLANVDRRILSRYLGADEARRIQEPCCERAPVPIQSESVGAVC